MFGDQSSSRKRTSPAFGFGSSGRAHQAKVFMSPEHAKMNYGQVSPGPSAYSLKSAVGTQPNSKKPSYPSWVFGTADRFVYEKRAMTTPGPGAYHQQSAFGGQSNSRRQSMPLFGFGSSGRQHTSKVFVSEDHAKNNNFGMASPGPNVYNSKTSVGRQDQSKNTSAPSWVFGSASRFKYDHVKRAATTPGPGAYTTTSAVGMQSQSSKTSMPLFGFGSSERGHQTKVYLSPEHEKMNFGHNSPGPAVYSMGGSVERQPLSKNQSMPSWGFGSANRWAYEKRAYRAAQTPGPGSYCI